MAHVTDTDAKTSQKQQGAQLGGAGPGPEPKVYLTSESEPQSYAEFGVVALQEMKKIQLSNQEAFWPSDFLGPGAQRKPQGFHKLLTLQGPESRLLP